MSMSLQQNADVDELFEVRNAYYIGNYQHCINEAQKMKISSAELKLEKDVFIYQTYIAQKRYRIITEEVTNNSPMELQILKLLAEFLSNPKNFDSVLTKYKEKFGSYEQENHHIILVAATMYYHVGQFEKALQLLHPDDHVESLSLALQIYLAMSRVDLARRELKRMQEKDEDSTLTQLAQVWVNIALGRDKLQDAYYIVQEIIDKYGSTVNLLNMQAVCYIGQGKYEEADSALLEAMEKDDTNATTLINAIALSAHLKKPSEVVSRYLTQLKESHSNSPYIEQLEITEEEFEKLNAEYQLTS